MKLIDYKLKKYDTEKSRGQVAIRTGVSASAPSAAVHTFSITWSDRTMLIFVNENSPYTAAIHLTLHPAQGREFNATFRQSNARARWYEAYRTARTLARRAV